MCYVTMWRYKLRRKVWKRFPPLSPRRNQRCQDDLISDFSPQELWESVLHVFRRFSIWVLLRYLYKVCIEFLSLRVDIFSQNNRTLLSATDTEYFSGYTLHACPLGHGFREKNGSTWGDRGSQILADSTTTQQVTQKLSLYMHSKKILPK